MAHDVPMLGHLVINKNYQKLSNQFVCLTLTSDVSNYCWFYYVRFNWRCSDNLKEEDVMYGIFPFIFER